MLENSMVRALDCRFNNPYYRDGEEPKEPTRYVSIHGEEPDVPFSEALDYAIAHLKQVSEEDKQEFVEWFYSSNWVKV